MRYSTRRGFLRSSSVVGAIGIAGCSQITGGNSVEDSDGDGKDDSHRDPEEQDSSNERDSTDAMGEAKNSIAVDGFEDGNIRRYSGDLNGFNVQSSVAANGNYALKGQVKDGDNQSISRSVKFSQPNNVQGYVKVIRGGGNENAHIKYLNGGKSGSTLLHINFRMNEGSDGYGDVSGSPKLDINGTIVSSDIGYDEWYLVTMRNIDWENEVVGQVLLDQRVIAEQIDFQESGSDIDTVSLKVNDWGNEIGYFDDVSVGY
mgnify:CR=1 FL=1